MGKFLHDDVLDSLLDAIADNGDRLTICTQQPTTYTEAASGGGGGGYMIAWVSLTPSGGGPDYTYSDAVSGRQAEVAAQSAFDVLETGTATHVAIVDSSNLALKSVTTCTSQALTSGGLVATPSWVITVNDPT